MEDENGQKAKSSKLRRQRGYRWEDTIVKRFNQTDGWRAFRLGSSSVFLPDVLAVNTDIRSLVVVEAKSGSKTSLLVPSNQIERCLEWCRIFDIYDNRLVILAFKFLSKKRLDIDKYEPRALREYYKIWNNAEDPVDCVCTYDGKTYALVEGVRRAIQLQDCTMPFT